MTSTINFRDPCLSACSSAMEVMNGECQCAPLSPFHFDKLKGGDGGLLAALRLVCNFVEGGMTVL